ncbi:MAG: glucose-6-phosphate dehydrogenase, partial [Acidimicrobiales bacterium]
MSTTLVILGGLGDLATRHLVPALAELQRRGELPEGLRITGVARRELDTADYRERLRDSAIEQDVDPSGFDAVLDLVRYVRADATDADQLGGLEPPDDGPIVFYLAVPPAIFAEVFTAITALDLGDRVRVAIEKPFGEDLDSARELNRVLDHCFSEDRVFRVDHFLGHPSIRRLPRLRAAPLVASIWDARHLESIEVVWDETIALEGRAGYYDHTGALRDVLQNHLLQVLAVVTMELPDDGAHDDLASARLDALRQVAARVETSVRARYTAGTVDGVVVPAYVDEPDVDPDRSTETLAEVELEIDNPRWAGTAVSLRSGKALGDDRRCVVLRARG